VKEEIRELISDIKLFLEYQKLSGIELFEISSKKSYFSDSLKIIKKEVLKCTKCRLHQNRKKAVPGEGREDARLVFIGEAPGRDEDIQGKPFVGKAGQLLTKIIEAIDLKREDVYITNIVKCRPPENRNPNEDEIQSCEPYLLRQLRIIKPKIICALGTFAAQALLKTNDPISTLRGRFHLYGNIKLMPTYHPAYLLRYPFKKREAWEDIQLVQKEYNQLII
jgi:uracil-DNA glycosylase family 4